MIYVLVYGVIIIIALILQTNPLIQQLLAGIVPDLLLVVLSFLAINYGKTVGGVGGLGIGFLQDLLSGGLFGTNAISKAITGYLCGFLRKRIYEKQLIVPPLVSFAATLINQLLVVFFTNYLLSLFSWQMIFKNTIIPLALCNAALAIIIYPILYKLGGNNK